MKNPFKTIGIVGGAGPQSSALLYKMIIDYCQHTFHAKEDYEFPKIVLINYPFSSMVDVKDSEKNHEKIIQELQNAIDDLAQAKVDVIGIACNTLHTFIQGVNFKGIDFVHIVEESIKKIKQQKRKKILFLGTPTSVAGKLYQQNGIELVYPNKVEQQTITSVIHTVLAGNCGKIESQKIAHIVNALYRESGIDGVLLGCTELPLLHDSSPLHIDSDMYIFDTLKILAEALVAKSRD